MILKVIFANSVDPDQSDQGPHCLPECKNRFEKSARIFSRRHKQTFSDAVFLGALRVKARDPIRFHVWRFTSCICIQCPPILTFKALVKTVADDILKFFFFYLFFRENKA